jgi:hypothetical protein
MSDLAAKVRAADQKIAARWQTRVARKMDKPVLTAEDIDYIAADLAKRIKSGQDLTLKEGDALILISNASIAADSKKAGPGIERLVYYVKIWEKAFKLNYVPMVTDDELMPIADFLRNGVVSRVRFLSPGTGITYAPYDYIAVGQLVLAKEVLVAFSRTAGLSEYASDHGRYNSESNIMIINSAMPLTARLTLVHEATHVIQDWQDISHLAKYHEADAFIAEGIARRNLTTEAPTGAISLAAATAADIVINNAATSGNKAWRSAYDGVVAEVVKQYQNDRKRYDNTRGETKIEKPIMVHVLREIAMINKAADVASREIARVLLEVLP